MKILLLGEYSGFHGNLKAGLIELGHEAIVAASGDGFKKLKVDIDLGGTAPNFMGKIKRIVYPFLKHRSLTGFDVVQFVNTNPLVVFPLNKHLYQMILSSSKRRFVAACGDDYEYYQSLKLFKYHPYSVIFNNEVPENIVYSRLHKRIHDTVIRNVDGVIPSMFDYALGYKSHAKVRATIPLPIDTKAVPHIDNKIKNNKIHFFHGINRTFFKGTRVINEALDRLKSNYPNDVKVTVSGNMPLQQYLEVLKTSNVVLDQCKGYSYGMNALYSLAQSKMVMSGSEPEAIKNLGIEPIDCPIVNITPSVNQIYSQLLATLDQKNNISDIGEKSRKYVEKYHDSLKIAQKYINAWQE